MSQITHMTIGMKRAAPLTPLRTTLFAIIWIAAIVVAQEHEGDDVIKEDLPVTVTFVNEMPDVAIELFWENPDAGARKSEGSLSPRGGSINVDTYVGHEFSYDLYGTRHFFSSPEPNSAGKQFAILAGDSDSFLVRCELQSKTDLPMPSLDFVVKPYWAPRGASRFLELVRHNYFDGVVLNRVVGNFLTQFGIARDQETKEMWDSMTIPDDQPFMDFEPGYVSFAGSGPDSRTTEIFMVMPGASDHQLAYFGENSWETPFAHLQDLSVLTKIYSGYGDMPPYGEGPDSSRIYEADGYDYLAKNFPNLDYVDRCYIVDEETGENLKEPEL